MDMSEGEGIKLRKVHINIREDLYLKLWELIKRKYPVPTKKLHIELANAIEEYLRNHGKEYGIEV